MYVKDGQKEKKTNVKTKTRNAEQVNVVGKQGMERNKNISKDKKMYCPEQNHRGGETDRNCTGEGILIIE